MVYFRVNDGDKIKFSDAQAYAIHCILLDYIHNHKCNHQDEVDICTLINAIYDETEHLTEVDRKHIKEATINRKRDGSITYS